MYYNSTNQESISSLSFTPMSQGGIREWLESLPRANTGELCKQLYMALQQLSVLSTKPSLAAVLLAETLPHVEHTAELLMQKFLLGGRRDAVQAQKAINLIHQFCRMLHRSARNHRSGSSRPYDRQLLAIELKTLYLDLSAYQMSYMDVSDDFWQVFNKLLGECLSDDLLDMMTSHGNIGELIKGIILLATAQTNQLLARDIHALVNILPDWAGETHIQQNSHGILCFPNSELKPVANSQQSKTESAAMSLDTRPLTSRISHAISDPNSHMRLPEFGGVALLAHVTKAWSGALARHMARSNLNHDTECQFGLAALHLLLDRTQAHQMPFTSDYKIVLDRPDQRDVWSEAYNSDAIERIDITEQRPSRAPMTAITITDLSPGGYGIRCDQPPSIMQAGELIGIAQRNDQLHLGLLRWLKQSGATIRAGVELISPSADACLVRVFHSSGRHSPIQRGLWLNKIMKGGSQSCLILPTVPFKNQDTVEVQYHGQSSRYKLAGKVMSSSRINVFKLQEVKGDIKPEKPAGDDFDNMFKLL